jgi:hypothetical protein
MNVIRQVKNTFIFMRRIHGGMSWQNKSFDVLQPCKQRIIVYSILSRRNKTDDSLWHSRISNIFSRDSNNMNNLIIIKSLSTSSSNEYAFIITDNDTG